MTAMQQSFTVAVLSAEESSPHCWNHDVEDPVEGRPIVVTVQEGAGAEVCERVGDMADIEDAAGGRPIVVIVQDRAGAEVRDGLGGTTTVELEDG